MKELLHSSNQVYLVLMPVICLMFALVACHSPKENKLILKNSHCFSSNLMQQSIDQFVQTLGNSVFSLKSPKITSVAASNFPYTKSNKDLLYLPAALWKLYAIEGEIEGKHLAEEYTRVLGGNQILEDTTGNRALLYVYLSRYAVLKETNHRTSLLHALSKYLTKEESAVDSVYPPDIVAQNRVEKLLENELLFFASQETGDPVYGQLAKRNSEIVFDYFFLNNNSAISYNELLDRKKIEIHEVLNELTAKDFYYLSLIFYGFTILNEQENNERYHAICNRLAHLFASLFTEARINSPSRNYQPLLDQKLDALPRVWIALALHKLNGYAGNAYQAISEKMICQILAQINKLDTGEVNHDSPRLYYYLLTYFKQKEHGS